MTIGDISVAELAAVAQEAGKTAAQRARAAGLPVTGVKDVIVDGRMMRCVVQVEADGTIAILNVLALALDGEAVIPASSQVAQAAKRATAMGG